MPNHLMSRLHFSGEQKRIDELLESIKGEETLFDFNTIIPMPESLNIEEGSRTNTEMLQNSTNTVFVDMYADEGITGTSTAKRTEFQRLMNDCRKGKIDRILTKSISRFARNTKDSLRAARELKTLGISVYFEKENIDTGEISSEMLLAIYSQFAQEESMSISRNCRLVTSKNPLKK